MESQQAMPQWWLQSQPCFLYQGWLSWSVINEYETQKNPWWHLVAMHWQSKWQSMDQTLGALLRDLWFYLLPDTDFPVDQTIYECRSASARVLGRALRWEGDRQTPCPSVSKRDRLAGASFCVATFNDSHLLSRISAFSNCSPDPIFSGPYLQGHVRGSLVSYLIISDNWPVGQVPWHC